VPKIGDMVLINDDDHTPRMNWKRGVIVELISGKDNMIRGVTLRVLSNGKFSLLKRPIQRLVPFEIVENEEEKQKIESSNNCCSKLEKTTNLKLLPNEDLRKRPQRTAAIVGDMKRKLAENKNI
jgi:hypothetical protein